MNEQPDSASTPPDRLPMPPDHSLTPSQRQAAQQVRNGPRGELFGPFVPLLRSPAALTHLQRLGAYLRFDSALPSAVFELAVLLTARSNDQSFEWAHHVPLARAAGLPPAVIDAIAHEEQPAELDENQLAAYRLITELLRTNRVDDRTYHDAVACFDEQGVIELVVTVGYYTTLALTMNTARTPPPTGPIDTLSPSKKAIR